MRPISTNSRLIEDKSVSSRTPKDYPLPNSRRNKEPFSPGTFKFVKDFIEVSTSRKCLKRIRIHFFN